MTGIISSTRAASGGLGHFLVWPGDTDRNFFGSLILNVIPATVTQDIMQQNLFTICIWTVVF